GSSPSGAPSPSGYRPHDEVGADGGETIGAADLELARRLGLTEGRRSEPVEELGGELPRRKRPRAVGMDQLGVHPEPKRCPAVLLVVAAALGLVRRRRLSQRRTHERPEQLDESARTLEGG